MNLLRWALGALWPLLAAGCATLPAPPLVADEAGCHAWNLQLDEALMAARVADAEAERIAGFPGLRVDRIGQALRTQAQSSGEAYAAWVRRAAELDERARAVEIANLPSTAWPLDGAANPAEAEQRTGDCRQRVVRQLLASPPPAPANVGPLRETLMQNATVPDRYSASLRAVGLYPLVRWPFFAGVLGWQATHSAEMARWAGKPPPLQRFGPALASNVAGAPAGVLPTPHWPPAADALGLPQPSSAQAAALLAWHAPVFELEVRGSFDRFGAPSWGLAAAPQVDTSTPVVFTRITHTRLGGRWLLQLVYTVWFPERPPRSSLDLLAGALDGVIVRLTLSPSGEPMLMDTIHACGCYHLFFPGAALRPREGASRSQEWLFAPAALPPLAPGDRLVVRLASVSHYVMGVAALPHTAADVAATSATPAAQATYALWPEEALRSLPAAQGRRSLFGPGGLVEGTERGERFLFWPMGIASAGAMRQWGHHATAFVGRRHFDDVDLLEQRFERIEP